MKIGLLDVDSHNFPNLALMKISKYHKMKGDDVEFINYLSNYDIVYKSQVFTYSKEENYKINAKNIIYGGTGYNELEKILPNEIENIIPDYDLYKCKHAYGFLTRGCIRNCDWCIVYKKEGKIKSNADIEDIMAGKKSAILLDNNVLAHEHGIKQIEKIIKLKIKIDFNQGIDCRLIDNKIAEMLSQVKWLNTIRFSCDNLNNIKDIKSAIDKLRLFMPKKHFFCYVLVTNDIKDALERVLFLRENKIIPFAQSYIDYSGNKNITKEQNNFCRWVNIHQFFYSMTYEQFLEQNK